MAINFKNYGLQDFHRPDYSSIADVLPNVLQGYKIAKEPARMERQREKEELANRLGEVEAEFARPNAQSKLGLSEAQRKNQLAQAMLSEFTAKNPSVNPHLTPTQRELAAIHGFGTPEYTKALGEQYGIIEGANVPQGAIPLAAMGANERNAAVKDMTAELKKSQEATKAVKRANEMLQLIEQHPNMADYFSTALVDPNKKGFFQQLKRIGVDKKDLAALEKFNKLSSDLVLHGSQAFGGQKFTDARQALLEAAKPSSRNTDEANRYVLNNIIDDLSPYEGYGKALQGGFQNRYYVPPVPEDYRKKPVTENDMESQMQNAISAAQPSNNYTQEDLEFTAQQNGITVEEVMKLLGGQ